MVDNAKTGSVSSPQVIDRFDIQPVIAYESHMPSPSNLPDKLKEALSLTEEIQKLQKRLDAVLIELSGPVKASGTPTSGKTAAGKTAAGKTTAAPNPTSATPKKGTLTPEGRAKLSAVMKARWAEKKKKQR